MIVRVANLAFRYRDSDFALEIADFAVTAGERVAMVGPSGCGKTTLLHLLCGILSPDAGEVRFRDVDLSRLGDRARRELRIRHIGLVFQEFELLDYLNVLDNILIPFRMTPALTLTQEVRGRAEDLAERLGIGAKLRRPVRRLSHGERQRVAVCRSLLTRPELLLADEPTGNLDPPNKRRVLDAFLECVAETRTALLVVTHDRDFLDRFDRVVDFKEFHGSSRAPAEAGGAARDRVERDAGGVGDTGP